MGALRVKFFNNYYKKRVFKEYIEYFICKVKFSYSLIERVSFMDFDKILYYGATPTFVLLFIFLAYALVKNLKNNKKQ